MQKNQEEKAERRRLEEEECQREKGQDHTAAGGSHQQASSERQEWPGPAAEVMPLEPPLASCSQRASPENAPCAAAPLAVGCYSSADAQIDAAVAGFLGHPENKDLVGLQQQAVAGRGMALHDKCGLGVEAADGGTGGGEGTQSDAETLTAGGSEDDEEAAAASRDPPAAAAWQQGLGLGHQGLPPLGPSGGVRRVTGGSSGCSTVRECWRGCLSSAES